MTFVDLTSNETRASATPSGAGRSARRRTAVVPSEDLLTRLLALRTLPREELCAEWRRLFRANPPDRFRTDLLVLGIAWKIQEKARGGPKKAAETGLRELARSMNTTDDIGRAKRTKLKPGARLVREWGGAVHEVTVVERGFEWNGRAWASLSGIAEAITGAHWSGPRFFGPRPEGRPEVTWKDPPRARRSQPMRKPKTIADTSSVTRVRAVHCAVYTRKSSEEGLEQSFNSLDAQREACEAYGASQKAEGWGGPAADLRRRRHLRRDDGAARP